MRSRTNGVQSSGTESISRDGIGLDDDLNPQLTRRQPLVTYSWVNSMLPEYKEPSYWECHDLYDRLLHDATVSDLASCPGESELSRDNLLDHLSRCQAQHTLANPEGAQLWGKIRKFYQAMQDSCAKERPPRKDPPPAGSGMYGLAALLAGMGIAYTCKCRICLPVSVLVKNCQAWSEEVGLLPHGKPNEEDDARRANNLVDVQD
jgi:hypothetical protein